MSSSPAHLLAGVPLIESPFFDQIFVDGAFDADVLSLARQLRRDGYAIIDFPDTELGARIDRIRAKFQDRYDWPAWRSGKIPSLRLQDAWSFDEDVKAIALNQKVTSLLSTLYGRRAFPFQTINFPVGTQQPVHSDAAHFTSHPERFMCGVWVALEDIGPDQGPLVYLPGSHRWPIYTNEHLGVNSAFVAKPRSHYEDLRTVWDAIAETENVQPQRFIARKGQALIWTANLLHGGDRMNNLSLTRWSQVTHYFFDDCCYFDPIATDPFFGKIRFRDVRDIGTGELIPHKVGGQPVPQSFIQEALKPVVHVRFVDGKPVLPDDFNDAKYLELNPDVAAAGMNPREHFFHFGAKEGRHWR